jgi:phage tail sheath protein FI
MIMIQDSIQSSLESMVFEPNVASTWTMATASIDAFLNGLWQQGALAGTKASDAYKVSVGLGLTMTAQDVLDGKMIVQIMVAPARPAEFILLQFTQMLQTS